MQITGQLRKMLVKNQEVVHYRLPLGDDQIDMNELVGKEITLKYEQEIACVKCGRATVKSFNQGFCYPCFKNAPEASECIIHPEKCQAHLGIGRDMEWERKHHLQTHIVYLSLTSGIKVGVTRDFPENRWIDQGAARAIKLAETPNRYLAGMIEVGLKQHMADKTNWRKMIMNVYPDVDLIAKKQDTKILLNEEYSQYILEEDEILELQYPVTNYPVKVTSIGFDKVPEYTGKLVGIKGQYLIFENGIVMNVRKHTGYIVSLSC